VTDHLPHANARPSQCPLTNTTAPAEPDRVLTDTGAADEVKQTTCYMCACRCGIDVYLKDGAIRAIQGNKNHPKNKGVLCGKGGAGIMHQLSPAKLTTPLLRDGPRGSGQFRAIGWDEALDIAAQRLATVRGRDPKQLAFFTGRDQSQSFTGWWAAQFGTPNFAAHGGFCSVNMAAGGLYTVGGSFWEFGEPDWDHASYFLLFGVAEDHDSNPIKIGLGKLKERGAKIVAVNPVRTGYNAIADEWIGIRPGTDGLFILALVHELLQAGRIDLEYLIRYTNAAALQIIAPGTAEDGMLLHNGLGAVLGWDRITGGLRPLDDLNTRPVLSGRFQTTAGQTVEPVFVGIAKRYLADEYAPDTVAATCGVSAASIRRIAAELASVAFDHPVTLPVAWNDVWGRRHEQMVGRPVAMHAMRGISAHSNGFQTCRALHLLQVLLGTVDVPGGFRFKPPFPKPIPPSPKPAGKQGAVTNTPLGGMPLGFVAGPEDLLVNPDGAPLRIDKAYSWDAPIAAHGLMHMVIRNAHAGDPYPIDTLFMYMANMAWNSSMNTAETISMLTDQHEDGSYKIPFIIYSDAFHSETVAYADLVLPDTTYFERYDCISLLDRPISDADGAADAIRHPILKPDRDVRPFQDVLLALGARLGLPGFVDETGAARYRDYADYIVNHERTPGLGPLAGFRGAQGTAAGKGAPNPHQLDQYIANGGFWRAELAPPERYFKMANADYLATAQRMGFIPKVAPIRFHLYSEPLQRFRQAARGFGKIQPPASDRDRIERFCDPLPFWYPPLEEQHNSACADGGTNAYPLHAITQRPMHMYHSWGSQNAWLRQITSQNRLFVNRNTATAMGLTDDDWVMIESPHGQVKGQLKLMDGVNPHTVWTWNAIGKRAGAWGLAPDAPESQRGFLLNHAISELLPLDDRGQRRSNSDPVTGQAAWFDLRVRLVRCEEQTAAPIPMFDDLPVAPGQAASPAILRTGVGVQALSPRGPA
jgi:anaerobic selenocysteine-containing dehydrogenase